MFQDRSPEGSVLQHSQRVTVAISAFKPIMNPELGSLWCPNYFSHITKGKTI